MERSKIIGREYEQSLIRNYLLSDKAELIAVYGRRRVGKTYLVKSLFNGSVRKASCVYAHSFISLKRKNGMSETPLN